MKKKTILFTRTIKNFEVIIITALILFTTISCKNSTEPDPIDIIVLPPSPPLTPKTPETPTVSPPGGQYASVQNVTLSTKTAGAAIHYTLNGDIPSATSAQYTSPIIISHSTTIKAVAIKDDLKSIILTATYNIPRTYNESVHRVTFTGDTATVNFDYLSGNDIYLVKVNTSDLIVDAANTGNARVLSPSPSPDFQSDELLYTPEKKLLRMGHPGADAFNANPPPIIAEGTRRSRAIFVPPIVGDTRMFWVESYYTSGTWVQKQATMRATGQYGNIWIMDENYGSGGGNKITTAQAQTLAAKFDLIYPIETNLLGFEYGGGPGGDGGKDSDPKIQILVYDIVDTGGNVQAAGFFWNKDFYDQATMGSYGYKTNLAEIFYVDASSINSSPDYMYSTLIHEFQHMINFNDKYVNYGSVSASWYNEMLSMMAEDVIAPMIGIYPTNSNHEINTRIPTFLITYNQVGITEWNTLENESYAKGFAFGAYLLRNYGGASLLKEMLANNSTNIDSVTAALKSVEGTELSFDEALRRFGEVMIFSGSLMPEGVMSFDKTVTKPIGSYTYTAIGFDVWNFGYIYLDTGKPVEPKIFALTEQISMRPYSIIIHSANGWKNRTGSISITLDRPDNPNIELYLMVR